MLLKGSIFLHRDRKGEVMKKFLFYARKELLRGAAIFFGALASLCCMVFILEDADGRFVFYCFATFLISCHISLYIDRKEKEYAANRRKGKKRNRRNPWGVDWRSYEDLEEKEEEQ